MSEYSEENEELAVPPQTDTDVLSLIKKMQQQLNFLEKKIDILIGQSPERPFGDREKRFSKPFRPSYGGGSHHGKGNFNRGPRKEGFSHDRPREGGFSQDRPRERSFGQERPFDRKPSAGPRGFGHGDKPFFRHRKGSRS
jgi:hypothetical protein